MHVLVSHLIFAQSHVVVVGMPHKHAGGYVFGGCAVTSGGILLQVASKMASAELQLMMDGYEREKECSDLDTKALYACLLQALLVELQNLRTLVCIRTRIMS